VFHAALGVTGIVLTKLDGTAKGGIVLAIADALSPAHRWVGVGEAMEDLSRRAGRVRAGARVGAAGERA